MKKYIKPKTVVIKIDDWPLLAGSGKSNKGGGYAKRYNIALYNIALVDASPVGRSLNEDSNDNDTKWY